MMSNPDSDIPNPRFSKATTTEECAKCGCKWVARIEGWYGHTFFVDEDGICPKCGTEVPD